MKIYTKGGDKGRTSLIGGERVYKDDSRVDAYGTVDELSAAIAYLRDCLPAEDHRFDIFRSDMLKIQEKLMNEEALLCACGETVKKIPGLTDTDLEWLESRIDEIERTLKPLERFTIPGGHPLVSWSHVCRTICRRAERTAVKASHEYEVPENAIKYLNRLSDYLYVLGRRLSEELGAEELYWEPSK